MSVVERSAAPEKRIIGCDLDTFGMFCQECGTLHSCHKNNDGLVTGNVSKEY